MSGANIKSNSNSWHPKIKDGLRDFRRDKLEGVYGINENESLNLINKAAEILSFCPDPNGIKNEQNCGLVFGDVQSGKTLSFTSLAICAVENGYRIVVIIVGTKTILADQNQKRLKEDLNVDEYTDWFHMHNPEDNKDTIKDIQSEIDAESQPYILLTVMKSVSRLNRVSNILSNISGVNNVLIIDDEADQASMNTNASNDDDTDISATYKALITMKNDTMPISSYIQYTATPQAPLFISLSDILSPNFVVLLEASKYYTGLKTFFIDNGKKYIKEIRQNRPKNRSIKWDGVIENKEYSQKTEPKSPPDSLKTAVIYFLFGVAYEYKNNGGRRPRERNKNRSMLIHPHQTQRSHEVYRAYTMKIINSMKLMIDQNKKFYKKELQNEFNKLVGQFKKSEFQYSFDDLYQLLPSVINETKIAVINSAKNNSSEIKWKQKYSWIIIGGGSIDRGTTVEGLTVTYLPRKAVGGNADTIQQRCRFFGYKSSYLNFCSISLPADSYYLYKQYFEHENSMKQMIKNFYNENPRADFKECQRQILIDKNLKLTRKNILHYEDEFSRFRITESFSISTPITSDYRLANNKVINEFYNSNFEKFKSIKKFPEADTILRQHRSYVINPVENQNFQNMLNDWSYDGNDLSATIKFNYLKNIILSQSRIMLVYMGVGKDGDHSYTGKRSPDKNKSYLLPMGRSTGDGGKRYGGDRAFRSSQDIFTIQVYRFKHDEENSSNHMLKTSGFMIYTPHSLSDILLKH